MSVEKGILGIDFGGTNIGLAFGRGDIVTPLKVISGKNVDTAISDILRVIKEYDIGKIVLGLPLTADDKETPKSLEVRKFAKLLKIKSKLPLEFMNEFYTSKDASTVMLNMGVSQKSRRIDDHYVASLILKRYFKDSA